jgi:hypothetical protein
VDSLAVDSAGNVIVTGTSADNKGVRRIRRTAKYSGANGARLWDKHYQGAPNANHASFTTDLRVDNQGNVIVTGLDYGNLSNPQIFKVNYAASDGAMIRETRNATNLTEVTSKSLVVDRAGNVIATGAIGSAPNRDGYTAKYRSEDLALLWEIQYNGTEHINDGGFAVTADESDNVIVTGRTNDNRDTYTVKYSPVDLDLDDDGLLDSWEIEHFGSPENQGALDDTDGDAVVELLELAFATNPKSPASVPSPVAVVEGAVGEDAYLTTTIAKQPGVAYLVETGATLDGDFSAASTVILINDTATLKVRDDVPIGTQPERFLRVQVMASP